MNKTRKNSTNSKKLEKTQQTQQTQETQETKVITGNPRAPSTRTTMGGRSNLERSPGQKQAAKKRHHTLEEDQPKKYYDY